MRRLLALAVIGAIVVGCAPGRTVLPTANPSMSLAVTTPSEAAAPTLGPAKCTTTDTTSYAAVGWIGTRVVLLADHFAGCDLAQRLISVDPSDGILHTDATLDSVAQDFQIASDGESVIVPSAAGVIVLSGAGNVVQLSRPSTAADGWGGLGFRATADGGYLVVGAAELDRVAPDFGSITTRALPQGYVAVAPTSDVDRFILAPSDDASIAYGLGGAPFHAYLWDIVTGGLRLVSSAAAAVLPSPRSLAYLTLQGDKTLSVGLDGTTTVVSLPGLAWLRSPNGQRYLSPQDPQSRDLQAIALCDSTTGRTIVSFEASIRTPAWRGSVVALVSGGGDLSSELMVVDGPTVIRLPLP
jgi:hypothetical protein